jgi:hypothetical protein
MITDMVDLEPLVGQYDPGMILVGPLHSHSKNSKYRYFYIAGNGSKVYEAISLGFVEVETIAQTQRADFVVKLESRFAEVLTFGSFPEMARAVHERWPNVETVRFLAFAELEAKSEPTKVADKLAPERVVPGNKIDDKLAYAPPWARDQRRPKPVLRPPQTLATPSRPIATLGRSLSGYRTVPEQQRNIGGERSLASIILRHCAVGGAAALTSAVIAWAIVRPSTRQAVGEAAPAPVPALSIPASRNKDPSQAEARVPPPDPNNVTQVKELPLPAGPAPATVPPSPPSQISVSRNNGPSQTEAAVPPSVPNQHTKTNGPAPQAEPTPAATVTPSPQSQPLQVASAPTEAAPISGPQSPPAQVGGTAMRLDAKEIATLVNRGTDSLKSGDVSSARLLLRRAAEAGSASAALMLGSTFDPLFIQQLGTIGVVPDVAQARKWYEQAASFGSEAASQRLANLAHAGQ